MNNKKSNRRSFGFVLEITLATIGMIAFISIAIAISSKYAEGLIPENEPPTMWVLMALGLAVMCFIQIIDSIRNRESKLPHIPCPRCNEMIPVKTVPLLEGINEEHLSCGCGFKSKYPVQSEFD